MPRTALRRAGPLRRRTDRPRTWFTGLDAATTYVVVSAAAFAGLAGIVPLALPEVLVPGTSPVLFAIAVSVFVLAAIAVRGFHRTGRPAVWWSVWATFVLTLTGACVLDHEIRQLVALSLIVGPVYSAMFMRTRSVLWHVLVAEICCAALAASTDGPVAVRVLRVLCSFVVSGTLISGLIVLRRRLDAASAQAHESSRRDPLTNLLNRRGLHHHLPALLDDAASGAGGTGVAVLVADIDRFKTVNDTYGHAVGDKVLVAVADALRRASRPDDLLARLGGEELLLVAAVPQVDVAALADRLRATVEELTDVSADGGVPSVTISVGGAWSRVAPDVHPDVLLRTLSQRADELMYAAKEGGRNLARTEPHD